MRCPLHLLSLLGGRAVLAAGQLRAGGPEPHREHWHCFPDLMYMNTIWLKHTVCKDGPLAGILSVTECKVVSFSFTLCC